MSAPIRRRRLIAVTVVLGAVVIFAALVALRPQPQRRQPASPAPLVTVHEVTATQPPIEVEGWGTVEAKRVINLVPQVSGKVVEVADAMRVGAFFTAGEELLRIDPTDYRLAVEQARSQVARAEYDLATVREEAQVARSEWRRLQQDGLATDDLTDTPPNALVFREPQLRQAEAALEAARASLAQAELNLDRCTLTAPFPGRVLEDSVDLGQYVRAGEVLGRVYDIEAAEITVNLSDRDLAWVRVPQSPDDPTVGSEAVVRGEFAGATHTWSGRAARLGGAVDEASRTVPVVVEVADPYVRQGDRPPLLKGLFVHVVFASDPPAGSVTIPRRGLRPRDEVWVRDGDGRLRIRQAEVVRAGVETAVIGGGLRPGDQVITSNLQYVVDGMAVRVDGQAAPADPADAAQPATTAAASAGREPGAGGQSP